MTRDMRKNVLPEDVNQEVVDGDAKVCVKLDGKYYFREVPNNYTIASKYTDNNGNSMWKYHCYYPHALGALKEYMYMATADGKNIDTVEKYIDILTRREKNIEKVLGDLSTAKRKYERTNEMLEQDIKSLRKQLKTKTTQYNNLKQKLEG